MTTQFDECLQEGIDDLLSVDGETAIWYAPNGAPGKTVTVTHTMQTTPVEAGDTVTLYTHRANSANNQIDPKDAQGGILTIGKKDWWVVQVETHTVASSTFLLSESPIHGRQGDPHVIPEPTPENVTYQGGDITYNAEQVTYAGTL